MVIRGGFMALRWNASMKSEMSHTTPNIHTEMTNKQQFTERNMTDTSCQQEESTVEVSNMENQAIARSGEVARESTFLGLS